MIFRAQFIKWPKLEPQTFYRHLLNSKLLLLWEKCQVLCVQKVKFLINGAQKKEEKEKELVAIGSISSKVQVVEWYVLCNDNKHTSIVIHNNVLRYNGGFIFRLISVPLLVWPLEIRVNCSCLVCEVISIHSDWDVEKANKVKKSRLSQLKEIRLA